jgi:hypothetical protein
VARSVLGQHQLPPLIRKVIPLHMWRALDLADGSTLQYLTDRDIEAIDTWLFRLVWVLEHDAAERVNVRINKKKAS